MFSVCPPGGWEGEGYSMVSGPRSFPWSLVTGPFQGEREERGYPSFWSQVISQVGYPSQVLGQGTPQLP